MTEILEELRAFCTAGDFTNLEQMRQLLERYGDLNDEVREKCQHLRWLLSHGMVAEARNYYQMQRPPLRDQINALRFPGVAEWKIAAELNGLAFPLPIDDSVLAELSTATENSQGLQTLLMTFRQVIHGDDVARKVEVVEKILELQPGNAQWEKTLRDLERPYREELLEKAKAAIQGHQVDELGKIQEKLERYPWSTPIRPEILVKISNTLRAWQLEAAVQEGNALGSLIWEDFYRSVASDVEQISEKLRRWEELRQSFPEWQPDAQLLEQIAQVQEFVWEKQKSRQREEELAALFAQCRVNRF